MPGSSLFAGASIGLALLATMGCANATRPFPVKGTILFEDGQPAGELVNYLVAFESPKHHTSAVGVVGEDGTFHLKTFKDNDGAIPGSYRVILTPPLPPEMQTDRRRPKTKGIPSLIDPRYEKSDSTELTATVEPRDNVIILPVKRAKRRG